MIAETVIWCSREGCRRRSNVGREYCSALCRNVDYKMMRTQRLCEAFGTDHGYLSQMWTTVVEISDKLTELDQLDRKVFHWAERERGITRDQYHQITTITDQQKDI